MYKHIVVEFIDNLKLNYHEGENLNHTARIAAKRICKSTKPGVVVSVSKCGVDAIELVIGNRNKRELQLFKINYSALGGELVAECDVNNPVILRTVQSNRLTLTNVHGVAHPQKVKG